MFAWRAEHKKKRNGDVVLKLFFLHLPKCAGMTVLTALQKALPSNEIYQCTSMVHNYWANKPEFPFVNYPRLLRVVFGHWVHEEMLRFMGRPHYLCTSLRDPIERLKSQYRFEVKRAAISGWPLPEPQAFLDHNRNALCATICNAFPTMAQQYSSQSKAAIEILSCFDMVYDSIDSDYALPILYNKLGLQSVEFTRENTSDDVAEQIDVDEARLIECCAQDIELYDEFVSRRAADPEMLNPLMNVQARARLDGWTYAQPNAQVFYRSLAELYARELYYGEPDRQRTVELLQLQRMFLETTLTEMFKLSATRVSN